jgi:hypothetical protein
VSNEVVSDGELWMSGWLIIGLGASKDVGVRNFLEGKGRAARILGGWMSG